MLKLGYAFCGSFCTFEKSISKMKELEKEYEILPIMSETSYKTDTRFGKSEKIIEDIENICKKKVIHTITGAEPLGPKKMVDILLVAPCTGNTLGKLANAITDTSVTMAVKSCLRIGIPVVLCVCTNDALGASLVNIGKIMNSKNIYLANLYQDDPINKPNSLVTDFSSVDKVLKLAIENKQIQPLFN